MPGVRSAAHQRRRVRVGELFVRQKLQLGRRTQKGNTFGLAGVRRTPKRSAKLSGDAFTFLSPASQWEARKTKAFAPCIFHCLYFRSSQWHSSLLIFILVRFCYLVRCGWRLRRRLKPRPSGVKPPRRRRNAKPPSGGTRRSSSTLTACCRRSFNPSCRRRPRRCGWRGLRESDRRRCRQSLARGPSTAPSPLQPRRRP